MSSKTIYAIILFTPFSVLAGEMGTGGEAGTETVSEAVDTSVESGWSEILELFDLS